MKHLLVIALGAIVLSTLFAPRLEAASYSCPCMANPPPAAPYPAPEKTKYTKNLGVGKGKVKLKCTNGSATGDFVYIWCSDDDSQSKPIGRCIFVGGKNKTWVVNGDDGKPAYYYHECLDGPNNAMGHEGDDNQPWLKIVEVFCIAECQWRQECWVKTNGTWMNIGTNKTMNAADFAAESPRDNNGDTVPDQGMKRLTKDLYPEPPPPLPAGSVESAGLLTVLSVTNRLLLWDIEGLTPLYTPNHHIFLHDIPPSALISVHPAFLPVFLPGAIRLDPIGLVSPVHGETLAVLTPFGPGGSYGIVQDGAAEIYTTLFMSNARLHDLVTLTDPESRDVPGYGCDYGAIPAAFPLNFSINYLLPGNVTETGTGVAVFDQESGLGSGRVTFSQPPNVSPIIIQIPAALWLVLHYPSKADGLALSDLPQGQMLASMVTQMGPVGTAVWSIQVNGNSAQIQANLSGLNFGAAPVMPPIFELFSTETVTTTMPGQAQGQGQLRLGDSSVVATDQVTYQFPSNPSAVIPQPITLDYHATVEQSGPTTFTFRGESTGTRGAARPRLSIEPPIVPNPSVFHLLLSGDSGRFHDVEYSPDLLNWFPLARVLVGSSEVEIVAETDPGVNRTFYRAKVD